MEFKSSFPAMKSLPGKKKNFSGVRGRALPPSVRNAATKPVRITFPDLTSADEQNYSACPPMERNDAKLALHRGSRIPVRIPASRKESLMIQAPRSTSRHIHLKSEATRQLVSSCGIKACDQPRLFSSKIPVRKVVRPRTEEAALQPLHFSGLGHLSEALLLPSDDFVSALQIMDDFILDQTVIPLVRFELKLEPAEVVELEEFVPIEKKIIDEEKFLQLEMNPFALDVSLCNDASKLTVPDQQTLTKEDDEIMNNQTQAINGQEMDKAAFEAILLAVEMSCEPQINSGGDISALSIPPTVLAYLLDPVTCPDDDINDPELQSTPSMNAEIPVTDITTNGVDLVSTIENRIEDQSCSSVEIDGSTMINLPLCDDAATEEEIKSSKTNARKAKRNRALLVRRREKKLAAKLKQSEESSVNPNETEDIMIGKDSPSVHGLIEIVPASDLKLEDFVMNTEIGSQSSTPSSNGITTPVICVESDMNDTDGPKMELERVDPYTQQVDEIYSEYLYLSNLPFSVPGQMIASFFGHLIGPVKDFNVYVDENGQYTGKASVFFFHPEDATKTLLMVRRGLAIQGHQVEVELFVNGLRMHAHDFPEDPASDYHEPQYYMMM